MENAWILLALIAALTGGTSDALTKKALQLHDEYTIAWLRQLVVVLLLSPYHFFEQRRWHHFGEDPDIKAMRHVYKLLDIREDKDVVDVSEEIREKYVNIFWPE
jgi:uncharacterized membrane protein